MDRRSLLTSGLILAVAGCADLAKIPVEVKLPANVLTLIDYANAIIAKAEALVGGVANVKTLIAQAKKLIADLHAGNVNTKEVVGMLAAVLGAAAKFLPAPYNLAADALLALMDAFAGTTSVAARRGPMMPPEQALALLRTG